MAESENILQIDETQLNKDCVRLPNQYRQVAFQAANTDRDIAELKSEIEIFEAEFRLKVRAHPEGYGLEKVTEGAINELVTINAKYIALNKKLRDIHYKRDLEKALIAGLEIKKRSLTNLVELHGAGYYAEVRPSSQGRESLDKISRERQSRPLPGYKKSPPKKQMDDEDDE